MSLNTIIKAQGSVNEHTVIAENGHIMAAIALSGTEPTQDAQAKTLLTRLLRATLQRLPFHITLSQYYFHQDSYHVTLKPRAQSRADFVSKRRAKYLNEKRNLNSSQLIWVLEVPVSEPFSTDKQALLKLCIQAIVDKSKRQTLALALSHSNALMIEERALYEQLEQLDDALENLHLGLSLVSYRNQRLSAHQLFFLHKALLTFQPQYLHSTREAPSIHWDRFLANVDVEPVKIEGTHYLKVQSDKTMYVRIAAVRGCGEEYMPEAAWSSDFSPVSLKGNYLFFSRFTPMPNTQKRQVVVKKRDAIYRSQLNPMDLVLGGNKQSVEHKIANDPQLKQSLEELAFIGNDSDHYGLLDAYVAVFHQDINALKKQVRTLNANLENSGFHLYWETTGLLLAYESLLPGYAGTRLRATMTNTTKAGAMSLFYRTHEGLPHWSFRGKDEEALYIFESDDGTPFHYTPFVGDKCLVIGVGPTRSGKTFLKQVLATHFSKLGGIYCSLDVDRGSEAIARFYQEEAAIFRLENARTTKGFNPFQLALDEHDELFHRHMMSLIGLMLGMNEATEMQSLNAKEQLSLSDAITLTLKQTDPSLRNFSSMLGLCVDSVKTKLRYFQRGERHGNLFDNDVDAIGVLDKPISIYNCQGVKDSPELLKLVNTEILFRCIRLFEKPEYRESAKFLEVDEAQFPLSVEGQAERFIACARSWNKHGGGMGFWTQSPKHYADLDEWSTLRSSATTFFFMSDPEMAYDDYLTAFPFLTQAECDIIMGLKPRQQAYIKQLDENIAKVINIHVEPEQYVIATSRPHEAALAERIYQEEPDIDKAISKIIHDLNLS